MAFPSPYAIVAKTLKRCLLVVAVVCYFTAFILLIGIFFCNDLMTEGSSGEDPIALKSVVSLVTAMILFAGVYYALCRPPIRRCTARVDWLIKSLADTSLVVAEAVVGRMKFLESRYSIVLFLLLATSVATVSLHVGMRTDLGIAAFCLNVALTRALEFGWGSWWTQSVLLTCFALLPLRHLLEDLCARTEPTTGVEDEGRELLPVVREVPTGVKDEGRELLPVVREVPTGVKDEAGEPLPIRREVIVDEETAIVAEQIEEENVDMCKAFLIT